MYKNIMEKEVGAATKQISNHLLKKYSHENVMIVLNIKQMNKFIRVYDFL